MNKTTAAAERFCSRNGLCQNAVIYRPGSHSMQVLAHMLPHLGKTTKVLVSKPWLNFLFHLQEMAGFAIKV
jgi:hypothetical protein